MTITKFTVVESKWLRGGRSPSGDQNPFSRLENEIGEKCCMGFLAEACGVPQGARRTSRYFRSVAVEPFDDLLPEPLRPRLQSLPFVEDPRAHGELAQEIYTTNDDRNLDDDLRKAKLAALFAEAGIEVEFVP